jgi:hypothetical protein
MVRHLTGDTEEARQRMREEVLSTQASDFRAFAGVLEQFNASGQVVVMGSRESIEAALESEGRDWLEIIQVL